MRKITIISLVLLAGCNTYDFSTIDADSPTTKVDSGGSNTVAHFAFVDSGTKVDAVVPSPHLDAGVDSFVAPSTKHDAGITMIDSGIDSGVKHLDAGNEVGPGSTCTANSNCPSDLTCQPANCQPGIASQMTCQKSGLGGCSVGSTCRTSCNLTNHCVANSDNLNTSGCSGADVCQSDGCHSLVEVVNNQSNIVAFTNDSSSLYWLTGAGSVVSVASVGGTPKTLAVNQNNPNSITADTTNVYWTNNGNGTNGSVVKVEMGGGGLTTLATAQNGAWGISVSDNSLPFGASTTTPYMVYWTANNNVNAVPVAGGASSILMTGLNVPGGVYSYGNVWLTDYSAGNVIALQEKGSTVSPQTPITLTTSQNKPTAISAYSNNVFWTSLGDGTIKQAQLQAGNPTLTIAWAPVVLYSSGSQPNSLVVDGTNVYWTDQGNGTVSYIPMASIVNGTLTSTGSPTTIATGQVSPFAIQADNKYVYWVVNNSTVMKYTK